MNGIRGAAQVLNRLELPGDLRYIAEIMDESSTALMRLIEDVLDVAQNPAGEMRLTNAWFDIAGIVDSVADALRPEAKRAGLAFATEVKDAATGRLLGDAARVRQILLTLAGNAVRHGRTGDVRLGADYRNGALKLAVLDSGVGMSAAEADRAFEPFARSQASHDAGAEGLGLGLAVVRQIVARMGGEISMDSAPNQGTKVSVSLPMEREAVALPTGGGRRALCIGGNAASAFVLAEMLRNAGLAVETATDPDAGAEAVAESGYDIVFVNLDMPDATAFDLARRLRGADHSPTRLVGVTEALTPSTIAQCRAAGIDGILKRPIRARDLAEQLDRLQEARFAA